MHVAVLTAYTSDYELGGLTEPVNRAYAARHGYDFVCRVSPPCDRTSERHPSWDKVTLVNEILSGLLRRRRDPSSTTVDNGLLCSPATTHLLWVDGDACVVRQEVSVASLWATLPRGIELLIGEDVTPNCLLNAV